MAGRRWGKNRIHDSGLGRQKSRGRVTEVYWQAVVEGTHAVFRQTDTDPSTLAGIGFSHRAGAGRYDTRAAQP